MAYDFSKQNQIFEEFKRVIAFHVQLVDITTLILIRAPTIYIVDYKIDHV